MLYSSMILPLLLSVVLAMYIIPRILVVSVKKDLMLPPRESDKGKRSVPRLGGVSLFPILVISVGAAIVFCMMQDWHQLLIGKPESAFVQYLITLAGLTTMYLLGVMDDLIGVSLFSKMVIEFLAASLIPLSGLWLQDFHGLLGIYEVPYGGKRSVRPLGELLGIVVPFDLVPHLGYGLRRLRQQLYYFAPVCHPVQRDFYETTLSSSAAS